MTTLHGIEVKVGDKVWDSNLGWDEVINITYSDSYPIATGTTSYTSEGFSFKEHKSPQLFWQEFEIPAHAFEKQKSKVKKYQVLFEYDGVYYTTSGRGNSYFSSEKDFCKKYPKLKFISLILESEIEEEE